MGASRARELLAARTDGISRRRVGSGAGGRVRDSRTLPTGAHAAARLLSCRSHRVDCRQRFGIRSVQLDAGGLFRANSGIQDQPGGAGCGRFADRAGACGALGKNAEDLCGGRVRGEGWSRKSLRHFPFDNYGHRRKAGQSCRAETLIGTSEIHECSEAQLTGEGARTNSRDPRRWLAVIDSLTRRRPRGRRATRLSLLSVRRRVLGDQFPGH
jgi:hypothetical protein